MERLLPLRRSDASPWKLRRWGWLLCGLATGCFSQLGRRTGAIREQYFRHLVGLSVDMPHHVNVPELDRRFNAKLHRQSFHSERITSDPVNVNLSNNCNSLYLLANGSQKGGYSRAIVCYGLVGLGGGGLS